MTTGHVLPAAAGFTAGVVTSGPAATAALGARVAALLRGGEVLLVHSRPGAGKTSVVQGLCPTLVVSRAWASATAALAMQSYARLHVC